MFGIKKKKPSSEKVSFAKKAAHILKIIKGEITLSDDSIGLSRKKIIHSGRILFASGEKFMKDDCFTKASSIAYATIVSLIPTLAVALTFLSFGNINREVLFSEIQKLLIEYNLTRLNLDPYIEAISTLLDNAARIGGIGIVVLIFSATAVLRTMEHSLNTIWKTQRERPIVLKMIYYWAALTLFPIMLIAGTTAAAQISSFFTMPNNNTVYAAPDDSLWVAGDKGIIRRAAPGSKTFNAITAEQIDFDNQKIYSFDNSTKSFYKEDVNTDHITLEKFDFNSIYFRGSKGWIVGKNGYMLTTDNEGIRWHIERWGQFSLNDITMINDKTGFIAASGGFLLKTVDGGISWEALSFSDLAGSINKIEFRGKNGYALCNRGYILKTADSGANWTPMLVEQSRYKKKYANLNAISFLDDSHAWIACDEGIILSTSDGLLTFSQKRFKKNNFYAIALLSQKSAFIAGDNGIAAKTTDGGRSWIRQDVTKNRVNSIIVRGGEIWAAGNGGILTTTLMTKNSWEGETGTGFVISLLNFFGPFVFIWLSFLLVYLLLPNVKIPFKPAAIGASITGAIWVSFILGFIVYVKSFANGTFAVYGALAAFPLFLLLVYASAVIILYGAEVSYMVVYLDSYLRRKRMKKSANEAFVYTGIRILHEIYRQFESGKGATSHEQILKLSDKSFEAEYYESLFKNAKLITENSENEYMPSTSSQQIRIADVLSLIHDASFDIPLGAPNDNLRKKFSEIMSHMKDSRNKIVQDMTLSDLL